MRLSRFCALLAALLVGLGAFQPVAAAERKDVPDKYKWDLKPLFAGPAEWEAARQKLVGEIPEIGGYQGRLGESAGTFYEALNRYLDINLEIEKLSNYASQTFDTDTRVARSQEMNQLADALGVQFRSASSFVRPEIIGLGASRVDGFIAREPRLLPFKPWLDDILRWAPHTLSPAEEKIAAMAGNLAGSGANIRSIFANADFPAPDITLSDGKTIKLDDAAYGKWRASADREERRKVFRTFFTRHNEYRATFAATLYAQVQAHVFNKDVHHFGSSLEAALFNNNLPTTVYTQLITDVHANLPTLFRYLKLRQRMMGLPDLGYEDLYAPIVPKVDMAFTPEQSIDLTVRALSPLGSDYTRTLATGLVSGWTDWMPTPGKRPGAYSTITYGTHPYQLLNFYGTWDDVSTLAHESGHSMHSYLSDKNQPYVTHDYATFVAEVASTLNENLLLHQALKEAKDDDTRLFLLGNWLETLRTTLFRQTLFAEFELRFHEMVEKGEPVSGDRLNEVYLGLLRTYYGHDQGVCHIDSLYAAEWSYIPHFFYNFYVFQYATSLVASTSLAAGIRDEAALGEGRLPRRDAYLHMLSSGSSKYPIDLLREAGVDMLSPEPFKAAMREMNQIMDQMDSILARRTGGGH